MELSAKAVIVVDADLRSITPLWIRNLGEPLFDEYHFVSPLYVRHKYDGMITNNVAYPLTRALYGRRVRQPIGGDYGFSGELARIYAEGDAWDDSVGDVWDRYMDDHHGLEESNGRHPVVYGKTENS